MAQVGVSIEPCGPGKGVVLQPEGSLWPLKDSCHREMLWCPISQRGMLRAGDQRRQAAGWGQDQQQSQDTLWDHWIVTST